jgi:acetyltransferase-like isoleucine patch superfamily enzyme
MNNFISYLPLFIKVYLFNFFNRRIFIEKPFKIHYPLFLYLGRDSSLTIGKNFKLSNEISNPTIGTHKSKIILAKQSSLSIGESVSMSAIYIYAATNIKIGNNCVFGGDVTIIDTNFHSTNYIDRRSDKGIINASPIIIEDDVFIGTKSIILKGVHIGSCSIVAAGSVVTKDIPKNEIWGGNPAKFLRHV